MGRCHNTLETSEVLDVQNRSSNTGPPKINRGALFHYECIFKIFSSRFECSLHLPLSFRVYFKVRIREETEIIEGEVVEVELGPSPLVSSVV